jgi:hypothetical protein
MAEESADYYREKAAQCRRLARQMTNQDDPVAINLLALAVEFEAKAVALAAEEVSERQTDAIEDKSEK